MTEQQAQRQQPIATSLSDSFTVDASSLLTASKRPHHLQDRMMKRSVSRTSSGSSSPDMAHAKRKTILDMRREKLALHSHRIQENLEKQKQLHQSAAEDKDLDIKRNLTLAANNRERIIRALSEQSASKVSHAKKVVKATEQRKISAMERKKEMFEDKFKSSELRRIWLSKVPRSKVMDKTYLHLEMIKSQIAARKIQRCWRGSHTHEIVKSINMLELSPGVFVKDMKHMETEQLLVSIQHKELLQILGKFFGQIQKSNRDVGKEVQLKNATKVFLSAFLIVYHTREIMTEVNQLEEELMEAAKAMLISFEKVLGLSVSEIRNFISLWSFFYLKFQEWKVQDTEKILAAMFEHFMQLERLWVSVKDQVDAETEWKPRIVMQQKNIKSKILRVGGKAAVDRLVQIQEEHREASESDNESNSGATPAQTPSRDSVLNTSYGINTNPPVDNSSTSSNLDAFTSIGNEKLAHELIMDPEFEIKSQNSSLEVQITKIARKAFFDKVAEDPSNLLWVPEVLADVRQKLLGMIENNEKLRSEIMEGIDVELVKQQIINGVKDLSPVIRFTITKMLQLCAPIRDQAIKDLANHQSLPVLLSDMIDIIEDMRVDLANFKLKSLRPHLLQHAVEYERSKFAKSLESGDHSLQKTEKWLRPVIATLKDIANRRNPENIDLPNNKVKFDAVYVDALLTIIFSPEAVSLETVPETLEMDLERLSSFQNESQAITVVASLLMLIKNFVSELRDNREAIAKLKSDLLILLQDPQTKVDNLALLLISASEKVLADSGKTLNEEKRGLIKTMVDKTLSYKDTVFLLFNRRIRDQLRIQLLSGRFRRDSNSGLEVVQEELETLSRKIYHLAKHNREVHAMWYDKIISDALATN